MFISHLKLINLFYLLLNISSPNDEDNDQVPEDLHTVTLPTFIKEEFSKVAQVKAVDKGGLKLLPIGSSVQVGGHEVHYKKPTGKAKKDAALENWMTTAFDHSFFNKNKNIHEEMQKCHNAQLVSIKQNDLLKASIGHMTLCNLLRHVFLSSDNCPDKDIFNCPITCWIKFCYDHKVG